MGLRLFTAVIPSAAVLARLAQLVDPRRDADISLRWQRADKWHVTTSFMEDADPERVDDLVVGLGRIALRTAPFQVTLAGGRCLPTVSSPRVLCLAVGAGAATLTQLSSACRNAASRAGIAADGRRYLPHLTLARGRFAGPPWLAVVDSFGELSWSATGLTVLASDKRNYTELAHLPFDEVSDST